MELSVAGAKVVSRIAKEHCFLNDTISKALNADPSKKDELLAAAFKAADVFVNNGSFYNTIYDKITKVIEDVFSGHCKQLTIDDFCDAVLAEQVQEAELVKYCQDLKAAREAYASIRASTQEKINIYSLANMQ